MSASDKSKLNGIAAGAQVNTVTSVAGKTGAVTLTKSDFGLSNVDNTADSAKTVAKANQLTNERTIALFGDVTGSVNFNGSANVTMATTVADDSHNQTQLSATDITGQTINLNNLILNRTTPPYIQYYIEKTDSGSANITNSPTTGHPFLLIDEQIRVNTNTDYICRQQFISASSGTGMTYVRYCNGGTWTAWESIYTTSHKPSKSDVGLGNVDNTADSAKSVKYATSAGSANSATTATYTSVPRVSKSCNSIPGTNKAIFEEYTAGTSYNLPTNAFYHIITMEGSDSRFATQIALGMTADAAYYRHYSNSAWGSWHSIIDTNTTYGAATSSALGLVKIGSNITNSSGTISLTKANVTSALGYTPPTTNTTYSVVSTSANGLAPKLSGSTSQYLRGDGSWATPAVATSSVNGLMSTSDYKALHKYGSIFDSDFISKWTTKTG